MVPFGSMAMALCGGRRTLDHARRCVPAQAIHAARIDGKHRSTSTPDRQRLRMTQVHVRIRRGVPADAEALAAFAARTFAETFGRDNKPEDLHAHLAAAYGLSQQTRELSDPSWVTLLAQAGERLVAYAQIRCGAAPACVTRSAAVELHRFYVDQPWHGQGVARLLMAAVHVAARELGAQDLWLGVWERNPRAIAFYRKSGFVDVGSHYFDVGLDRQTDRVLVAALSNIVDGNSLAAP
jgi:GNAT superfamily N-acetyltransferase